jgi:hypothetical protein
MNANTETNKPMTRAERRAAYRAKTEETNKQLAFDILSYLQEQKKEVGTIERVNEYVHVEYLDNGWRLTDQADWLTAGPAVELAVISKDTSEDQAVEEIVHALGGTRQFDSIIARERAMIGDQVYYYVPRDNRWGNPVVPYNTTGTVVGRGTYTSFICEYDHEHIQLGMPTGEYLRHNGPLIIRWDLPEQPEKQLFSNADLAFVNPAMNKERDTPESRQIQRELRESKTFVAPLPVTSVRMGDVVISDCFNEYYKHYGHENHLNLAEVSDTVYRKEDDGSILVTHELKAVAGLHYGIASIDARKAHFWESGNYTRWIHKQPLSFESLKERCEFFKTLGFIQQQSSPVSSNYEWTMPDFLKEFTAGNVDATSTSGSFFGSIPFQIAHKVVDPEKKTGELRTLIRQAFIDGFKEEFVKLGLNPAAD